jgi:mannose-1-phosphate guanylyltransferase
MAEKIFALVMAGGRGTRFWPESTSKRPKQYLKLFSENSLLKETLLRFDAIIPPEQRYIVTIKDQESLALLESSEEIGLDNLIIEPSGRNTAPCILLSIATLVKNGAELDDIMTIVPADHVILNQRGLRETITDACGLIRMKDTLVTIGISPTFPHTGYGYIQKGEEVVSGIYNVDKFREKPNFETATEYLKTGNYLWNAGMFVGRIGRFLEEFQLHAPEVYRFYDLLLKNIHSFQKTSEIYNQIPKNSIDYAVMEKSKRVCVIPAKFDWNDLGSWDALEGVVLNKDQNTFAAMRDCYVQNASGNIVFAPGKFVTLIDVNDLIIVSNEKNMMVISKEKAQKVKDVVEYLENHHLKDELL